MQAELRQEHYPADELYDAFRARFAKQADEVANENTHSLHGELLDTLEEIMAAQRSHIITARGLHTCDALLGAFNA